MSTSRTFVVMTALALSAAPLGAYLHVSAPPGALPTAAAAGPSDPAISSTGPLRPTLAAPVPSAPLPFAPLSLASASAVELVSPGPLPADPFSGGAFSGVPFTDSRALRGAQAAAAVSPGGARAGADRRYAPRAGRSGRAAIGPAAPAAATSDTPSRGANPHPSSPAGLTNLSVSLPPALSAALPAFQVALAQDWEALAACESSGNPSAVSPTGKYRGLYQFSTATWRTVGGSGDPAGASAAEQTLRAQLLWVREGPGQWPVCGSRL